jgi:uncharacterized protein (TIGR00251 family)
LPASLVPQTECTGPRFAQDDKKIAMMTGLRLTMIAIHEGRTDISFAIKVHPRAKKNAIMGEIGDALRVSLTAPPIDGRANQACIEFFAKLLKVPRSSVTIASGLSSRNKVIRVAGISAAELRKRLQA